MCYTASCPICGRVLCKGSPNSALEVGCPKCGEYITLTFCEDGYLARVALPLKKPHGKDASRDRIME